MTSRTREAVLIPSDAVPHSLAGLRSLGARGVHTIVASEDERVPSFWSRYCDEQVVLPSPHDDLVAYKDALLSLAARPDVRAVLPNREEDAYVLARYQDEFERHVTPLWQPLETLRVAHDRLLLTEIANEAGVPAPETQPLDAVDDWDRQQIVKQRYSILVDAYTDTHGPEDCDPVHNVTYLEPGVEPDIERLREDVLGHAVVQEFVPAEDEYMVAALYDHGEPLATFHHRQIRGHSYTGGGSVYRRSTFVPELEETARTLLDHLDWHGLACIEYMKDARTGEYVLTEINPRFWRSLPLTVRAGADFPHYYWLLARDELDRIDPRYETGVASHFLWGELRYLRSVLQDECPLVERPSFPTAVWDVASSMYRDPHFDYVRLDDPSPFARAVINTVREW